MFRQVRWRNLPIFRKAITVVIAQVILILIAAGAVLIVEGQAIRSVQLTLQDSNTQRELATDIRSNITQLQEIEEYAYKEVRQPGFDPDTTIYFFEHAKLIHYINSRIPELRNSLLEDSPQAAGDNLDVIREFNRLEERLAEVEENFDSFSVLAEQLTDSQTGALVQLRADSQEIEEFADESAADQIELIQELEQNLVIAGSPGGWDVLADSVDELQENTLSGIALNASTRYQQNLVEVESLLDSMALNEVASETNFTDLNHNAEVIVSLSRVNANAKTIEAIQSQSSSLIAAFIIVGVAVLVSAIISLLFNLSLSRNARVLLNTSHQLEEGSFVEIMPGHLNDDEFGDLAESMNNIANTINELVGGLEARVAQTTRDLNITANIGRAVVEIDDPKDLMNQAINLIIERFDVYHAQVFIVDEGTGRANLAASTGEPGRELLKRQHFLAVGSQSVIGKVTATGEPELALDTDTSRVHRFNELLPDTRSEMAVPLRIGDEIIGALDVQSVKPDAFNQDDVAIFQIIADQLAIALESSRLASQVRALSNQLETVERNATVRTWTSLVHKHQQEQAGLAYQLNEERAIVPHAAPTTASVQRAIYEGAIVRTGNGDGESHLAVPIRVRDQIIGAFSFTGPHLEEISNEDLSLVEAVVDRVGLALENLRLVQQATRRAEHEQLVNEITAQIVGSTDIDFILQTTVKELGRMLGAPQTSVQLKRGDSADG